jgi:hypothetical protein
MLVHVIFVMKNNYQQLSMSMEHIVFFVMIDELNYTIILVFLNAINNLNSTRLLKYDMVIIDMLVHNNELHLDIWQLTYMLYQCYIIPNLYWSDFEEVFWIIKLHQDSYTLQDYNDHPLIFSIRTLNLKKN